MSNYNRCLKCNSILGTEPYSEVHARTLDRINYKSSFAWCYNCGNVTHYKEPFLSKVLSSNVLRASKVLTLDQVFENYNKFDTNEDNYYELIWQISRCLVNRVEKNNPKREAIAWEYAKQKLQPLHLFIYLKIIRDQMLINPKETLQFMIELRNNFQSQINSVLYDTINSNRVQFKITRPIFLICW